MTSRRLRRRRAGSIAIPAGRPWWPVPPFGPPLPRSGPAETAATSRIRCCWHPGGLQPTPSRGRNVNFVGGFGGAANDINFSWRPRQRVLRPDPVQALWGAAHRPWAHLCRSQTSTVSTTSLVRREGCPAPCAQIGGGASRISKSPNPSRRGRYACPLVHSRCQVGFEPLMAAWLGDGAILSTWADSHSLPGSPGNNAVWPALRTTARPSTEYYGA